MSKVSTTAVSENGVELSLLLSSSALDPSCADEYEIGTKDDCSERGKEAGVVPVIRF